MRLVDKPATFPSRCAVIPFLGATYDGGFVDTGSEMAAGARDQHVYVSVAAVEQMAALIGWTPPADVGQLRADLDEAAAAVLRLEGELAEADQLVRAIDTLESADFRARKKTGRPRKTESEEAAA